MSMPVLVDLFLVLLKLIATVECAPKIGDILFDPLSFEAAEFEKEATSATVDLKKKTNKPLQAINDENVQNEMLQSTTAIPKSNAQEQKNTVIALNKSSETNKTLEILKPVNVSTENNTDEQNSFESSLDNSESDTNSSSEWLDPETERSETRSMKQISKHTPPQVDKENNKSLETLPLPIGRDLNPIKNQTIKMHLHITSKGSKRQKYASKREIITPQTIFMKLLRSAANTQTNDSEKSGIPCDGYDYDVTICRYIGDRYLCGYNKNLGDLKNTEEIEDLGNGCRMRGDRMECGYQEGPFSVGINRPDDEANVQVIKLIYKKTTPRPSTKTNSTQSNKASSNTESAQNMKTRDNAQPAQNVTPNQTKKACMEKDERIVCYDIPA